MAAACRNGPGNPSEIVKKRQCTEDGWKFFRRYREQLPRDFKISEPEFAYNSDLDTCLCYFTTFNQRPPRQEVSQQFIYDALANKVVAWSSTDLNERGVEVIGGMDPIDFTARRHSLMGK